MFSAKSILSMLNAFDIDGIREVCQTQIRIEEAEKAGKKPTNKTRISALKRCIHPDNKKIDHSWIDSKKHCFCNGYLAVALNEEVPEFPIGECGMTNMLDVIETAKTFTEEEHASEIMINVSNGIAENKMQKKNNKNGRGIPVILNRKCRIGFDPQYMNDAIVALGGYDEVSIVWPEKETSPIYLESKHGKGIVLPVRLPKIEKED